MKKLYKNLLGVGLGLTITSNLSAQAINESFDNITTLTASGWVMNNLSTPVGTVPNWAQGSGTTPFAPFAGTGFALANYNNIAGAGDISNWLISPSRTFNNGDVVTFYTRTSSTPAYADRLQVRLSVNGTSTNVGTTNASVGDFSTLLLDINPTLNLTAYPNGWTQYTINVSGLPMAMTGRLAFRYFVTNGGPTGANSDVIGIDNFVYTPVGAPTSPDVTAGKSGEYTLIPLEQLTSINLGTLLSNVGTASATDAQLKVNVYQASNLITPILTVNSPTTAIVAGGTASLTAGSFTPTLGNYVCKFISSCTGNSVTAADTSTYAFSVVNNFYARDNGMPAQGIGAGNTTRVIVGNNFTITKATIMDSVLFFCNPDAAGLGDTVRVRIANTTAGVPSNTSYIGESAIYKFTAANTNTATVTPIILSVKNLASNPLVLAPGTYFVGVEKYLTSDNYGLQCTNDIFTANTVYANINNGAYSPLNTLLAGFNYVPIIRPFLNSCSTFSTSVATVTNVSCNGNADGVVSVNITGGTLPYSVLWSNGQAVATNTGVTAGVYTATVTDAVGCIAVNTVSVTQPTVFTSSIISTTNVSCNGNCTGIISSTGTGGVTPYSHQWSNGATTASITGLCSGVYTNTLTDGNGCVSVITSTITQPTVLLVSSSTNTNTICAGDVATVTVIATGGTPAYTGTGTFTTTGGVNTYSVTDNNGCESSSSVTVTVNALPVLTTSTTNALLCSGETATLTATGTAISYTWSTSENTASIAVSPTVQTTYTVNGTGANGCSNSSTITQDVSLCTGINSLILNQNSEIALYPNPNNGLFVISLNAASQITVTNALGQVVFNSTMEAGKHNLTIQNQSTGIYFVIVKQDSKQHILKLIKE